MNPVSSYINPPEYATSESSSTSDSRLSMSSSSTYLFSSPGYTSQPIPDEVTLEHGFKELSFQQSASNSQWEFWSGKLVMNLGPRFIKSTSIPAYGAGDAIEGYLKLKSVSNVERVELIVTGTVSASGHNGSSYSSKTVLSHTISLTDGENDGSSNLRYPFSFDIPETTDDGEEPLPPTFYLMREQGQVLVRYMIKAKVHRKGIHRNLGVETAWLYLPRSAPPLKLPSSSLGWADGSAIAGKSVANPIAAPSTSIGDIIWEDFSVPFDWESSASPTPVSIQLSLQSPLSYRARSAIPARVSVDSPSSAILSDLILSSTTIQLVKTTQGVSKGKIVYHNEEILREGQISIKESKACNDDDDTSSSRVFVIGGLDKEEVGWKVDEVAQVSFSVRLVVNPPPSLKGSVPSVSHDIPISLTTHSAEEVYSNPEILFGPAMGLITRAKPSAGPSRS